MSTLKSGMRPYQLNLHTVRTRIKKAHRLIYAWGKYPSQRKVILKNKDERYMDFETIEEYVEETHRQLGIISDDLKERSTWVKTLVAFDKHKREISESDELLDIVEALRASFETKYRPQISNP